MSPLVVVSLIRDTKSAKCDENGWKKKYVFGYFVLESRRKKNVSKKERPNLY